MRWSFAFFLKKIWLLIGCICSPLDAFCSIEKVNLPPTRLLPAAVHAGNHRGELLCGCKKHLRRGRQKRPPTPASNDGLEHRSRRGLACVPERLSIESDTQTNPLKPTLHWGPFSQWKSERAPEEPSWLRFHRRLLQVIKKKKASSTPPRWADGKSISRAKLHKRWPLRELARHPSPSSRQYDRLDFGEYAWKKERKTTARGAGFSRRDGNASDCNPDRHDAARCTPPRARVSPLWSREKRSWVFHVSAKQIRLHLHLDGESLRDKIICIWGFSAPCLSVWWVSVAPGCTSVLYRNGKNRQKLYSRKILIQRNNLSESIKYWSKYVLR